MATESQASPLSPPPPPPPPPPPRRFFVQGTVSVDNVRANFLDAKTIETGQFFSLHDPEQPVFSLRLEFGSMEKGFLSAFLFSKETLRITRLRICIFTAEGDLLKSVYRSLSVSGFYWLLKLENTKGVDRLSILVQFEYKPAALKALPRRKALREDYSNIFESGDFTDIAFLVGDEKVMGHKAILAGRCSYFARMFKTDMKESDADEVEVKDIKPSVFRELLKFIYCGAKPKCVTEDEESEDEDEDDDEDEEDEDEDEVDDDATHEDAVDLLIAADRFGVDNLKKMCEDFLCDHLNVHNIIEVLIVADRLNCADLLQQAVNVYRMRSGNLKVEEERQKLKANPDILLKLMDLCRDG